MAGRFIDFDAARAERSAEPLVLKAFGKTFELPASLSAALMLDVIRIQEERGDDAEVTLAESLKLLRLLLPGDVLEQLLAERDFSLDDFGKLLEMVMAAYTGGSPGESVAPNRAARRQAGRSTRSRGSHPGWTSPKGADKAAAPAGATSSDTGTS